MSNRKWSHAKREANVHTTLKGGTHTTFEGGMNKEVFIMTLEQTYQKWLSIQPLSEQQQRKLSIKFSIEYNYNSNHMEGNTLTYGQTELLLLFGKVCGEASLKDFNDMKASEVSVKMMLDEASDRNTPLTQNFIRTLHHTLLREDKGKEKSKEKSKEKGKVQFSSAESSVLRLLHQNPRHTYETLKQSLGYSIPYIYKILSQLKKKKVVRREGGRKEGFWVVLDSDV